ncbi:MAG: hypothetical protein CM1200mP40_32280 [Gammaproteobacteria bacterium]|nr:MAG: hypothetical protein CM1200mP40_32280 [Gammaproteobacteria bacterium]
MGFRIENHLLDGAIHCPSPNWSERESGDIVDLLVIHKSAYLQVSSRLAV